MTEYRNAKIPRDLAELVDEAIKSGKHGYRSFNEFVIDSVRIRLRELGYLK